MEQGLQMYTVRDAYTRQQGTPGYISGQDIIDRDGFLKVLQDLGRSGVCPVVELAGVPMQPGMGLYLPADEVKGMLDSAGVRAVSAHVMPKMLEDDFDATGTYYQAIGCELIVIPYVPPNQLQTREQVDALAAKMDAWGEKLRVEGGMGLAYHNHEHELETCVEVEGEQVPVLAALLALTERTNVGSQLDIFWAQYGGMDPLRFMFDWEGSFQTIHMKDGYLEVSREQHAQGAQLFEVLGQGDMKDRLPDIVTAAYLDRGVKYLLVEQDEDHQDPPVQSAIRSLRKLDELIKNAHIVQP